MKETENQANRLKTDNQANGLKTDNQAIAIDAKARARLFRELEDGYHRTYRKWDSCEREYVGVEKTEFVRMDEPVVSRYHKTNNMGDPCETLPLVTPLNTHPEIDPAVYHGITLYQFRGVWANIERRCNREVWKDWVGKCLTPDTVNLYDVDKYVVKPYTEDGRKSFVSTLPSASSTTYQVPRIFISISSNTTIKELLACLEMFVHDFRTNCSKEHEEMGGGMTEHTPVWLFCFARNRWDSIPPLDDHMQTPVAAMKVTNHRVLSITDKDGIYFTDAWRTLEIFTALTHGSWCIYTAHGHVQDDGFHRGAVGLIPGGATSDIFPVDTSNREKHFPISLISKCIKFNVEDVKAQKESDRRRVLNWIIDTTYMYAEAPESHEGYTYVNDSFRAHFTTPGTLQTALLQKDGSWQSMLNVMSKGQMKTGMQFDFEKGKGWDELTDSDAIDLIKYLPCTIKSLEIRRANFGSQFINALSDWIGSSELTKLHIEDTLLNNSSDEMTVKRFTKALKVNSTLENLQIWRTNQEKEDKVWEEDVNIIEALALRAGVVDAMFTPLDELYTDDNPNFAKIIFLQTLFMRIDRSFPIKVSERTRHLTFKWVLGLSDNRRSILYNSQAGSFVKSILNHKFTRRENLLVIMLDLYSQVTIVAILSILNEKGRAVNQNVYIQPLLISCWFWILFRKLIHIIVTSLKCYITEVSTWVGFAQIALIPWAFSFFKDEEIVALIPWAFSFLKDEEIVQETWMNTQLYAMCISWLAIIFELSNIWFPLFTFVMSLVKVCII